MNPVVEGRKGESMNQAKRGGLGRGLAALIPTGPATNSGGLGAEAANVVIGVDQGATSARPMMRDLPKTPQHLDSEPTTPLETAVYREIPPDRIEPNPKQPRRHFSDTAQAELVHSIREFGLMQPIVVRRVGSAGDRYQIVMGERRWRAATEAGLDALPAIVRETGDDAMLRDALLENIHRVQLNPLEEAAAYQQLLDEFGVTHEELADRLGRSRPMITNMIRLLKLPIPVQRRVAAGILSAGHARALLGMEGGSEAQEMLAARIVAEGLSVRSTEEAVKLANREDHKPRSAPISNKPAVNPGLQDFADRLSESFDTRVTVSLGKKKGKIVVEFGSVDDLERIIGLMENNQISP